MARDPVFLTSFGVTLMLLAPGHTLGSAGVYVLQLDGGGRDSGVSYPLYLTCSPTAVGG